MSQIARLARAAACLVVLAAFTGCATDSSRWKCDQKTGFCADVKGKKKHASNGGKSF